MADILGRLINCYRDKGEYKIGARYAQKLVDLEPWSESSHRALMHLLAASGKRSAALKQYFACESMLASEFGIQPTLETRRLFDLIKDLTFEGVTSPDLPIPSTNKADINLDESSSRKSLHIKDSVKISAGISTLVLAGLLYTILTRNDPDPAAIMLPISARETSPPGEVSSTEESIQSFDLTPAASMSPSAISASQSPKIDENNSSAFPPDQACMPGEKLLYLEDFQDGQAQDWLEIEFQAQGWKIIPLPDLPEDLVASHYGNQDGKSFLQDLILENAVWRIWINYEGKGEFLLVWNHNPRPEGKIFGFTSYQMHSFISIENNNNSLYRVGWPESHISVTNVAFPIQAGAWHLFEVINYNSQTELWMDGKRWFDYEDPYPLPPGTVGVEVWKTEDENFKFYLDDISVCQLKVPFRSIYLNED